MLVVFKIGLLSLISTNPLQASCTIRLEKKKAIFIWTTNNYSTGSILIREAPNIYIGLKVLNCIEQLLSALPFLFPAPIEKLYEQKYPILLTQDAPTSILNPSANPSLPRSSSLFPPTFFT